MNLADKPCYPVLLDDSPKYDRGIEVGKYYNMENGLTFRERLIIALASNPAHVTEKQYDYAEYLLKQVDAIIKEMEKE
jgi:hypothetical protein